MKKMINFPSIEQYRNVIRAVQIEASYIGKDEQGEPIYDESLPKPIINFKGTVKLHGTNAGVSYNPTDGLWFQSRESIITVEKDNAGFAFFAHTRSQVFIDMFNHIAYNNDITWDYGYILTIYGEWVGKGIQKSVAIAELDKSFFIFGVKVSCPDDENFKAYWINYSKLRSPENRIYNIQDYPTYSIDIDFNNPEASQQRLTELTEQVEAECPVSKAFGVSGVGEGIVWTGKFNDSVHRFKTKGEKHQITKTKELIPVDVEKSNNIQEFVNKVVTKVRYEQAKEKVFMNEPVDIKKLGALIQWMTNDILKEELDTISTSGLEPKDVKGEVAKKTREMFKEEWGI
jgi:hypothetical protein